MKSRVPWLLACLFFFALPLVTMSYFIGKYWSILEKQSEESQNRILRGFLLALREQEDPEVYFAQMLRTLNTRSYRCTTAALRWATLSKGIRNLKRHFPGLFTFTVVDGQGRLDPSLTDGSPSAALIADMFTVFQKPNLRDVLKTEWTKFHAFVGPQASPDQIYRQGQADREIYEVNLNPEKRWFTFFLDPDFGFFVHLNQPSDWTTLPLQKRCQRFNQLTPWKHIKTGILDKEKPPRPGTLLSQVLLDATRKSTTTFLGEGYLFALMPLSTSKFLWVATPDSRMVRYDRWRYVLTLFFATLFAFLTMFAHRIMVTGVAMRFSIRWQLILLFIFAGGLPLAALIFLGLDYLQQKREAEIARTHDELENLLNRFDQGFPLMRGTIETDLNRLTAHCRFETPQDVEATGKLLMTLYHHYRPTNIFVYNPSGNTVWSNHEKEEKKGDGPDGFGRILKTVFRKLNNEPDKGVVDPTALMLDTISAQENPIELMLRNFGHIIRISVGGQQRIWATLQAFKGRNNLVTHIARIFFFKFDLDKSYVNRKIPSYRKLFRNTTFLYWTPRLTYGIPRNFPKSLSRRLFQRNLEIAQGNIRGRVFLHRTPYLATGLKLREMSEGYIVAFRPERLVDRYVATLLHRLWLLVAILGGITFFLGIMLSQRFLVPVSELEKAVKAIEARDFLYRTPRGEADELGDLAQTFNVVIEGLNDLDVARIVQESLVPQGELAVGEYRMCGISKSATELGGDYFDLQTLSGNRALLLIGDVSGHGVAAALIMAMAKAISEREIQYDPAPDKILLPLHRLMLKTMKRKRMMSCFTSLLNADNHVLTVSNAGHNYPIHFRQGVPPRMLEIPGTLVGGLKNIKLSLQDIPLLPGDRIFFYTDGLIEAQSPDGKEIGYDRMMASVGPLLDDDPKASCERVMGWLHGITGSEQPQADDITIVVLTRRSVTAQVSG